MSVSTTARRIALPLLLCVSVVVLAGLVAAYAWSPVTDTLIVVEFVFVLVVAPRVSKRLMNASLPDAVSQHVQPVLRAEIEALRGSLVLPSLPTAEQVATAVRAALPSMPVMPSVQEIAGAVLGALQAAQREAAAGAGAQQGAFMDALAGRLRQEMEEVMQSVDFGAPAPEEAAQVLAARGVQARYGRAAREEQFRFAIQQGMGPTALAALDAYRGEFPDSYRDYASRGAQGAQDIARDPIVRNVAARFGLQLPDAAAAPGAASGGQPFVAPPGARYV